MTAVALAAYAVLAAVVLRDAPWRAVSTEPVRRRPATTVRLAATWQASGLYALAFGGYVAFSRLVHVFSMPLGYPTRPYIVYRSRDAQLGTRRPRRGWERV